MSQGLTGRRPAGDAECAVDGNYPDNLAIGAIGRMGVLLHEDFQVRDDTSGGFYGDLRWEHYSTGTGAVAGLAPTSTDEHEWGLEELSVPASGDVSVLQITKNLTDQEIPVGTALEIKATLSGGTTQITAWAGFLDNSTQTTPPTTGAGLDFVGFRLVAAGAGVNWEGVVQTGSGEDTVDMGIAGSTGVDGADYARLGVRRLVDGSYEFYTVAYQEDPRVPPVITVVDVTDTQHPNETVRPTIGVKATSASARGLVVDYFTVYGRTRR